MPNVVIGNRSSICTLLVDKTPKQFYQLTYAPTSMYIYIRRVLDWHIRPPGLYPLGFATINNLFPPYQMGLFQHSRAFHVLRHMVYLLVSRKYILTLLSKKVDYRIFVFSSTQVEGQTFKSLVIAHLLFASLFEVDFYWQSQTRRVPHAHGHKFCPHFRLVTIV